MTNVSYQPKRGALQDLALSREVGDAMVDVAQRGKVFVEGIAPVGPTGNYSRGFRVRRENVTLTGAEVRRAAGAFLENTAPHAGLVEWHNGSLILTQGMAWMEQHS